MSVLSTLHAPNAGAIEALDESFDGRIVREKRGGAHIAGRLIAPKLEPQKSSAKIA